MSTTFESTLLGDMTYGEGLAAICITIVDLLDYLKDASLPEPLLGYTLELSETALDLSSDLDQVGKSFAEITSEPNSPQEAAAKMLRVYRALDRLITKTTKQAATIDPVVAIRLLALRERLGEQSIVIERYVWLGRTTF